MDLGHRRVLDLVMRHGWNATAFQTLGEGYAYFFHAHGCVAYVDTGAAWVAAGPPIAASENLLVLARAFADEARMMDRRCCFFASEQEFVRATSEVLAAVPIGEQPVWDPRQWDRTLEGNARLRWQLRRVRARGVQVRQLVPGELAYGDDSSATTQDLRALIDGWLATRRMPPMGFLLRVEPHASSQQRRCFVAEWQGRLVGLVYVIPVPRRNGWFVEHMVRAPHAPNGTVELLVDAAMRWAAEQGCPWFTLGLAPLSGDVPTLLRVARRRLAFLYNFDGLRFFKAKLRPTEWQPIFLSFPASQGALATVLDVLAAFAGNGTRLLQPKDL